MWTRDTLKAANVPVDSLAGIFETSNSSGYGVPINGISLVQTANSNQKSLDSYWLGVASMYAQMRGMQLADSHFGV